MCRTDFPIEFLERPELLMPIDAIASTSTADHNAYQWFYKGRNGWWQYDERTCQEIEDAYKNGDKHCTILVAGYVYVVDFEQMLQQRQTDPSRKRQVKRDLATIPKKGVAGLRLPNAFASSSSIDEHDYADDNSNSNIIATIAAAEAAIRIASDIIDSTLAHADDNHAQEAESSPVTTTLANAHLTSTGVGAEASLPDENEHRVSTTPSTSNAYIQRELLDEIEETLNISNPSSINNSFGTTANLDDFFKMTLNDFKNLTMSNIADDSSDDNNDDDDDEVGYTHQHNDDFDEQPPSRH